MKQVLMEVTMIKKQEKNESAYPNPIQFYIDEDLKQRLKKYCFDKEEKQAPVIREALDAYLKKQGY